MLVLHSAMKETRAPRPILPLPALLMAKEKGCLPCRATAPPGLPGTVGSWDGTLGAHAWKVLGGQVHWVPGPGGIWREDPSGCVHGRRGKAAATRGEGWHEGPADHTCAG